MEATFNKKSKLLQPFIRPVDVFRYFLLTRISLFTNRTLPGKAKLFFEKKLYGKFPDPVFSFAYLHHFVENDLTYIMMKKLKPGMVFIDGGAHIGYFTLLAAYLVGKNGQVHSFEVTPTTFQMLKKNVKDLDNVTINRVALWSRKTEIEFLNYGPFYAPNNSFTEARIVESILKDLKPRRFKTKTLNLDDYLEKRNIAPDIIKLDVESAEFEVLKGSSKSIKKYKPLLIIEYGDKPNFELKGTRDCIMLLKTLHYQPYEFVNGKLIKHKIRKNYIGVWGNLYFIYHKRVE